MSAGIFESAKYESAAGDIFACRAQPETKGLNIQSTANAYPAGAVDQPFPIRLRVGKRTRGLIPRTVTVRFTAAPPDGYLADGEHVVPVFRQSTWDTYTATPDREGTYLGTACKVVGFYPPKS